MTYDGRYNSIVSTLPADCNQPSSSGNDNTGAAIAVGAVALLGIAALAHRSHDHDDNQHYADHRREADYERGYRDGLYSHSYDRHDATSDYSRGYSAGVEQRLQESRYRDGDHRHH